jgi:TRAP-type C4-dicarboxylate transport system substrate-binding protein
MIRAILITVIAGMLAACTPAPKAGAPIVLRYASPYPPTHPFSQADIAWMKHVETQSGGRLEITPYWGGTLVSSEHATLELSHGVADIALVTPIYSRAGMKAIKVQAGFYEGAQTPNEQAAVYKCLARQFPVLTEEMAGVRVMAVQGGNLLHILTRDRKVARLEDLRGLRLRTPAEIAPLLRRLGVDPVTMPMAEVYSAMSKGVVDGVVAPADTLRSLHFSEVARYLNLFVVPRGAYPARAISDRAWAGLPPDLQKILADAQPYWESELDSRVTKAEAIGLEFGKTEGQVFVDVDPAEQTRLDEMYNRESLSNAATLLSAHVDGVKMFHAAQAIIGEIRAGRPPCA